MTVEKTFSLFDVSGEALANVPTEELFRDLDIINLLVPILQTARDTDPNWKHDPDLRSPIINLGRLVEKLGLFRP